MPVARLRPSSMPYALKSDEGNDSINSIIRQAIVGKEPSLSFSRTGDNPVQWVQLLHAIDPQDLPGWPLLTPVKVQMQKCEKCSREFCSSINYRRHIRVHRRSLNPEKDSTVDRNILGAFWDKLSYDDAMETVSFKNVTLEEVPGSSIVKALTSFIRKPGFSCLPYPYVKAGSTLLDIVQARASRFPISSQDLFRILDNASEETLLCGSAVSMQKYIFDGEAKKVGLEMKNLVACTSFLVEQKLVKAWMADKEAEALRCQKLLVEEEEAAQERKAELLERKRQKKLRQKEQKAKEQAPAEKSDTKERLADSTVGVNLEMLISPVASNSDSHSSATPDNIPSLPEPILQWNDHATDVETQPELTTSDSGSETRADGEHQTTQGSSCLQIVAAQKPRDNVQRHGHNREPLDDSVINKVWTRKPKPECNGASFENRVQLEATIQSKSCEVLIGSVPVDLGNPNQTLNKDLAQSSVNQLMVKLSEPVNQEEASRTSEPSQSGGRESEVDAGTPKANARSLFSEICLTSCALDESCDGSEVNSVSPVKESEKLGDLWFSIRAAEAFLRQRWQEAIAADHVQLGLSSESEADENRVAAATAKAKSRTKLETSVKVKCISEHRNDA